MAIPLLEQKKTSTGLPVLTGPRTIQQPSRFKETPRTPTAGEQFLSSWRQKYIDYIQQQKEQKEQQPEPLLPVKRDVVIEPRQEGVVPAPNVSAFPRTEPTEIKNREDMLSAIGEYGKEGIKSLIREQWGKMLGDIGYSFYEPLEDKPKQSDIQGLKEFKPFESPLKFAQKVWDNLNTVGQIVKYGLIGKIAERTQIDNDFAEAQKEFSDFFEKDLTATIERLMIDKMDDTDPRKLAFQLPSQLSSLAVSLGLNALTGSKNIPPFVLGVMESSGEYKKARQAGLSPNEAMKVYVESGAGTFILERIGLDFLLKKMPGNMAVQWMTHGTIESLQEGAQTIWQNSVAQRGYDETVKLFDDLVSTLILSFIVGALGGGGIQSLNNNQLVQNMNNEAIGMIQKELGVSKEEAKGLLDTIYEQYQELVETLKSAAQSQEGFARIPNLGQQETTADITGEQLAQQVQNVGTDGGVTTELIDNIKKEDYVRTEKTISELRLADPQLDSFLINTPEPRPFDGEAFALLPIVSSEGQILDGYNKILQLMKNGETTIEVYEGIPQPDYVAQAEAITQPATVSKQQVTTGVQPRVTRQENTALRDRMRTLARGYREGTALAKQQVKEVQTEFINYIQTSQLEAKDKNKFIRKIKDIQTPEQFARVLEDVEKRIATYQEASLKNSLKNAINKELKGIKPRKVGSQRVAKYDYATNKLLQKIKEYNKLTQEEAEAKFQNLQKVDVPMSQEAVENQVALQNDKRIEISFLDYKRNGMDSSQEMMANVLGDIQTMKEIGAEAKSDEDFIKKLNDQEEIDKVRERVASRKGGKDNLLRKIQNLYLSGLGNSFAYLNSLVGRDLALEYDMQAAQDDKDTTVFNETIETHDKMKEIYDLKNDYAVAGFLQELAKEEYAVEENRIDNKGGLKYEVSKLQLINLYNAIKNDVTKSQYYYWFGEDQVNDLLTNLTQEDIMFADWIMEKIQSKRPIFNNYHIKKTGRDLGKIKQYYPSNTEFEGNMFDEMIAQSELPSAIRKRSTNKKLMPKFTSALDVLNKHLWQAAHIENLTNEYEKIRKVFTNREVKFDIEKKFGKRTYEEFIKHLDRASLYQETTKLDAISDIFNSGLNNWVLAKVALSPSVFVKQLASTINSMEDVNPLIWMKYHVESLSKPKEAFDFMWNNSPWMKARFSRGYSETMKDALEGASKLKGLKNNYARALSFSTRGGDILAIVYGGYPAVKAMMDGGMSKEEAFKKYHQQALHTQQASVSLSLSGPQNIKHPFVKMFFRFKNTIQQYHRKQANAIIDYINNDISGQQLAKVTTIYSIIHPIIYASLTYWTIQAFKGIFGNGDDDREEWKQDILQQLALNPFLSIPLIEDIVNYVYRKKMKRDTYTIGNTALVDDMFNSVQKITKNHPTLEDWLMAMSSFQEPFTAIPTQSAIRYYKYATDDGKDYVDLEELGELNFDEIDLDTLNTLDLEELDLDALNELDL